MEMEPIKNSEARIATPQESIMLRFFGYAHLPEHLQARSKPFSDLAHFMVGTSEEPSAELSAGLRKLLEAKDCFVRTGL